MGVAAHPLRVVRGGVGPVEVRPGLGNLDYRAFLTEAAKLQPDLPIMLEHLATEEEYTAATQYVKGVAEEAGLGWK